MFEVDDLQGVRVAGDNQGGGGPLLRTVACQGKRLGVACNRCWQFQHCTSEPNYLCVQVAPLPSISRALIPLLQMSPTEYLAVKILVSAECFPLFLSRDRRIRLRWCEEVDLWGWMEQKWAGEGI